MFAKVQSEPMRFYSADGRGGQYLRVYPELGLLIVMTGGGCTIDDALPQIAAAVTKVVRHGHEAPPTPVQAP